MSVVTETGQGWRASKTTLVWACVLSALLPVGAGFFWGGWETAWGAHRIAAIAVHRARTELMAELCVNRFVSAPDAAAHLAELRDADPWARSDLLIRDGWTSVPGTTNEAQELPLEHEVGEVCAKRLMTAKLPSQHT